MNILISSSQAYKFYVGGKYGWVLNHSEDYNPWAERNRFQVGDSLFFKYEKGSNSVLVVNKDDYEKCYKKKPLKKFEDGNTEFQIDRSGPYFFISGKDDNCEKGQKLIVVVLALRPPPPNVPSTPKAPSPYVPTPSQTPSPLKAPSPSTNTPSPISQPPYISTSPQSGNPISQPPKAPSPNTHSHISEPPSALTPQKSPSPFSQAPYTQTPTPTKSTSPISQPPLVAQTPRDSRAPVHSPTVPSPSPISPSTQTSSSSPYSNSPSSLSPSIAPSVITPATSPVSDTSPIASSPPSSSLSPGGSETTPSSNETAPAPPNRTSFAWAATPSGLCVYSVTILVGFALTT
ncbi:putative cupredoxin [Lupinus albus]|uniref:Putative cupredoxin n=1 Tax=Lupinus albus TaxID=3870 RepID=A0A6A4NVG0_LUPAL|nr:putative cupredoxin [Lupinus albus]